MTREEAEDLLNVVDKFINKYNGEDWLINNGFIVGRFNNTKDIFTSRLMFDKMVKEKAEEMILNERIKSRLYDKIVDEDDLEECISDVLFDYQQRRGEI